MTDSTGIPLTNPAMGPSPTVVGHVEGQAVVIADHGRQPVGYYGDIIVRVDSLEELPP